MRVQPGLSSGMGRATALKPSHQGRKPDNVLRPRFGNNDAFQAMQARLAELEARLAKPDLAKILERVVPATATILVDATYEEKPKRGLVNFLRRMMTSGTEAPAKEEMNIQKGSGFWIRCKDGKPRLLTNAHVVNYDEKFIRYMLPQVRDFSFTAELNFNRDLQSVQANRQEARISIRIAKTADGKPAMAPKIDLALMEPTDESFYVKNGDRFELPEGIQPLEFEDAVTVSPGQSVFKVGSGSLTRGSIAEGIVSAFRKPESVFKGVAKGGFTMIESTVPLNQGDSGGPLLNQNGKVIGVNFAIPASGRFTTVQGIGWTISAADTRKTLADWGMLPDS